LGQPFHTKITLLDNSPSPGRKLRINVLNERPGISPIETSRSIRTSRHAVPAADTTVEVHHNNAIFSLPGCPGGTISHTRRIIALIAEHDNRSVLVLLLSQFKLVLWKDLFIGRRPDPFDLFLEGSQIGYIMDTMAGIDAIRASFILPTFPEVNPHPPFFPG
jgi:hypothetical protein